MIALVIVLSLINLILWSDIFYRQFFKRFYDIVLSGLEIVVLSPVLLVLTVLGAVKMKGNPFFAQERPGKNEKIFKLIKFRSMTFEKDEKGNLLPDKKRLTNYGKVLRSTSLDELPELINIFKGDMSIVGPRPLLVKYLDCYSEFERRRHDVRPGLTGLAQINGRNSIQQWEKRFQYDVEYINHLSLKLDVTILLTTIKKVVSSEDVVDPGLQDDFDVYRRKQIDGKGRDS
jgi:lipopolysaccharide/colanic/teichoic acid biosynthesis glycosyltransferase